MAATETIFFFQAEDGIRDTSVTGVQTCALPICCPAALSLVRLRGDRQPSACPARRGLLLRRGPDGLPAAMTIADRLAKLDWEAIEQSLGEWRSEERRVGKERRDRGGRERDEEKK